MASAATVDPNTKKIAPAILRLYPNCQVELRTPKGLYRDAEANYRHLVAVSLYVRLGIVI